ncbi:MAG TPA: hypothetical protein VG408_04090 [Actinomycetota bacterium]|nr:hypothetical protein [Actinomycetota bacterium]
MFVDRVTDPDGDVWRIRIQFLPPLPPLPRFRERARKIGALDPPYGIAESHYRLALRHAVTMWLICLWPLVLLGQVLVNVWLAIASLMRRIARREPWFIVASKRGHERSRRLEWSAPTLAAARRATSEIASAIAKGRGLYELDTARLLSLPIFEQD